MSWVGVTSWAYTFGAGLPRRLRIQHNLAARFSGENFVSPNSQSWGATDVKFVEEYDPDIGIPNVDFTF